MKIKSLLLTLITLCAASCTQASETKSWSQWLKSGLFATGANILGAGAVWYSYTSWNKKRQIRNLVTEIQKLEKGQEECEKTITASSPSLDEIRGTPESQEYFDNPFHSFDFAVCPSFEAVTVHLEALSSNLRYIDEANDTIKSHIDRLNKLDPNIDRIARESRNFLLNKIDVERELKEAYLKLHKNVDRIRSEPQHFLHIDILNEIDILEEATALDTNLEEKAVALRNKLRQIKKAQRVLGITDSL